MCDPGSAVLGRVGSNTMRRMPAATSCTSTTVACCQTSTFVAAMVPPMPSLDAGPDGGSHPAFGHQHPLDQPAHPHAAGVDIQVVELVIRIGVDGLLLRLEHLLVL